MSRPVCVYHCHDVLWATLLGMRQGLLNSTADLDLESGVRTRDRCQRLRTLGFLYTAPPPAGFQKSLPELKSS